MDPNITLTPEQLEAVNSWAVTGDSDALDVALAAVGDDLVAQQNDNRMWFHDDGREFSSWVYTADFLLDLLVVEYGGDRAAFHRSGDTCGHDDTPRAPVDLNGTAHRSVPELIASLEALLSVSERHLQRPRTTGQVTGLHFPTLAAHRAVAERR